MLPQKGDGVLRSIQIKCLTNFTAALQVVHPESISSAIEAGGFMLLFAAFSTDVLVIRVAFVPFLQNGSGVGWTPTTSTYSTRLRIDQGIKVPTFSIMISTVANPFVVFFDKNSTPGFGFWITKTLGSRR